VSHKLGSTRPSCKEKWDLELVAGGKMGILSFRKASTVEWSQPRVPSAFPVRSVASSIKDIPFLCLTDNTYLTVPSVL